MNALVLRLVVGSLVIAGLLAGQDNRATTNERILRIRELGKRNPAVLPALAQYLTDPNTDIRIEAVKSIVRIGTERSLDPLVQATKDKNEEVQIRATDGIVNFYVPNYVVRSGLTSSLTKGMRQIRSYFASRNDQVIGPGVQIRPDVASALSDLVSHGASVDAQANAALAAGILRDRAAAPSLVQALHAKDDNLIFESLVALQKIRDESAGPGVSFLAHDLDERTQITALETIGVLRSTESAPDVRAALGSSRNVKVKRAALETLAMLGQPQDRSTFLHDVDDRDVALRVAALEGLGRIREPEDFPTLEKAFDQGEIDSRIHLAAAFGMINQGKVSTGEFDPLPFLVENLRVRGRSDIAVAYLAELCRKEDVRGALAGMIPQMDKSQKIALCSALGQARTPEVGTLLSKLARDPDVGVVTAASNAMQAVQPH